MSDHSTLMRQRGYALQGAIKSAPDRIETSWVRQMLGVTLHAIVRGDTVRIEHMHPVLEVHSIRMDIEHPDWIKFETKVLHAALALALYGV